jgi:hypothetical protein
MNIGRKSSRIDTSDQKILPFFHLLTSICFRNSFDIDNLNTEEQHAQLLAFHYIFYKLNTDHL